MKTRKGYKAYPLTAAQNLHFYCMKYCPKKQVVNIGSSLTIGAQLDFDELRRALEKAVSRCESMRVRLAHDRKDGNEYQYVVPDDVPNLSFFDFTGWKEADAHNKMCEWTSEPFTEEDAPLYRIVMIRTPDGFEGFYLCVNHMIMDAQSLILFFRDVIELYCHAKYEGIAAPKEMASYIAQLEKDLAYEAGTPASKKDRAFFEQLIGASEPIFTDIYGNGRLLAARKESGKPQKRAVDYSSDQVDANLFSFHLEPEATKQLDQFCENEHISMTCLLLMGLRTYLQKMNQEDDVSLTTTIARRAKLQEKRSGGTRIHCFPFRSIVHRNASFLEGLYQIRDLQNQYFLHANYSPTEYYAYRTKRWNLKDNETYEPLSLTYQPLAMRYEGPGLEQLGGIQYKTGRYTNGVAAHRLYLTVSRRAEDEGMDFCFEYQTGAVTPEKLQELYYYLCRIMFRGVEDKNRTVGEIIDMV